MGATTAQINKHVWGHEGSLTCLVVCQVPSWASKLASRPGCSPRANTNTVPLWPGDTSSGHGTENRGRKTLHGANSPLVEVQKGSIYIRLQCRDGCWAGVICCFSRTQTRGIWQKQGENEEALCQAGNADGVGHRMGRMALCTQKAASAQSQGTACPGDTASRHLSPFPFPTPSVTEPQQDPKCSFARPQETLLCFPDPCMWWLPGWAGNAR